MLSCLEQGAVSVTVTFSLDSDVHLRTEDEGLGPREARRWHEDSHTKLEL